MSHTLMGARAAAVDQIQPAADSETLHAGASALASHSFPAGRRVSTAAGDSGAYLILHACSPAVL